MIPTVSGDDARKLLLAAQGLLGDPARRVTLNSLARQIERMGFVQIDTINVVERAHHLILASRFDGYDRAMLTALSSAPRNDLFEHWTHDASLIPTRWFAHWRPRFERYRTMGWHTRQLGARAERVLAEVMERVRRDGPLGSKDFDHPVRRPNASWWDWKPQKIALEYLWRTGDLYVVGRENFQKRYDLTERALPHLHVQAVPPDHEHVAWACRSALERIGVGSASEIAGFWRAIPLPRVNAWLKDELKRGGVIEVSVESVDRTAPRRAFALPDVQRRIVSARAAAESVNGRMRALCPFDPVLRDRARTRRLFDFDYRFEAFVPAAKRKHGYYVMPLLEGERLIGRVDPKLHRDRGVLEIRFISLEPGIRLTARRRAALDEALERLARFVGAKQIRLSSRKLARL